MYTQLNQYHVILEAQPQFQLDPDKLNQPVHPGQRGVGNIRGGCFDQFSGIGSTSAGSNA
jgi:multidrug efflux pump